MIINRSDKTYLDQAYLTVNLYFKQTNTNSKKKKQNKKIAWLQTI